MPNRRGYTEGIKSIGVNVQRMKAPPTQFLINAQGEVVEATSSVDTNQTQANKGLTAAKMTGGVPPPIQTRVEGNFEREDRGIRESEV